LPQSLLGVILSDEVSVATEESKEPFVRQQSQTYSSPGYTIPKSVVIKYIRPASAKG
jgi:hypothetical protein